MATLSGLAAGKVWLCVTSSVWELSKKKKKNCVVPEALSKMDVYALEKSRSVLAEGYCPLKWCEVLRGYFGSASG